MKHLILGAALLVLGFWGMQVWWNSFSFVIRALLPLALLAVGITALLSSYFRAYATDEAEDADAAVERVAVKEASKSTKESAPGDSESQGAANGPEPQES